MKKVLLFVAVLYLSPISEAQCPMCKTAVESARKDGKGHSKGAGLNDGILYLLATPYLAVAIVGGAWFYNKKKRRIGQ